MKSLQNKAEFDFVYKNGQKYYGACFNLYALNLSLHSFKNKPLTYKEKKVASYFLHSNVSPFLGLSVSKKVGNAPMRNLLKRRFRSFCRNHQEKLINMALVFVAKEAEGLSYASLEKETLFFLSQRFKKNAN